MRRPPAKPGPGRPKGAPNKINRELRVMILEALNNVGGVAYLETMSRRHPALFAGLLMRLLPAQVDATIDMPVRRAIVYLPNNGRDPAITEPIPAPRLDRKT